MNTLTIGATLAQWRRGAGMTQEQLAQAVACNRVTIAKVERDSTPPSAALVLAIARACNRRSSEAVALSARLSRRGPRREPAAA